MSHFIGSGLVEGDAVLVVATPTHRRRFRDRLTDSAFDLERAEAMGVYSELDAGDALARVMVEGVPVAERFNAVVGGRVALLQRVRPGVRVRAYAEMADLLWQEGNHLGALALEGLWTDLCRREALSLLCDCGADQRLGKDDRAAELAGEVARREALEGELRENVLATAAARAEAERTVRFNELFTGMLGHDLRNPLNAVATTAHYLTRIGTDARVVTAANRIISSSNRMARMIEQLLDLTRMRVGNGMQIQRSQADLTSLCESIKAELETGNPGHQIVLSSRGETTGQLDPDRMQQVISNVMANAVHHGTPGCVVEVAVDGTSPDALAIEVHNAGMVPEEVVTVLFEPFRAVGKGPRAQGLGLGLYLTRQLVQAHGGTITVASGEREGTTMRIEIPRRKASEEAV